MHKIIQNDQYEDRAVLNSNPRYTAATRHPGYSIIDKIEQIIVYDGTTSCSIRTIDYRLHVMNDRQINEHRLGKLALLDRP